MNDITPLVFTGLIGVGIGFAIGILVCSLRGGRKTVEDNQTIAMSSFVETPAIVAPEYDEPVLVAPAPEETVQPTSMNIVDVMSSVIQPRISDLEEPSKSIAVQIDDVLQEKLEESPVANQTIRLIDDPGKGVVVVIGLDQYEGVDAVPDPEIRALIRSAVREWETRVSREDQKE